MIVFGSKRRRYISAGMLAIVMVAGACSSDKPQTTEITKPGLGATTSTVDTNAIAKDCALDAFESAAKPVKITYWHSLKQANEAALKKLTDEFNASQTDVQVTLGAEGSNEDILTKYKSVAGSSEAPDLISQNETNQQLLIDSKAIVPVQACIAATKSSTDDLLARVRDYYTVGGAMWGMPFNVSQPVLLYNKTAFRNAGLDPEKAPQTLEELATVAKALQEKGGYQFGFQYKRDVWVLEQFLALAGEPYVDNDNGRSGRATKAVFNTPTATKVLTILHDLVQSGVASSNPDGGPEGLSNLFGICNGASAMTFDSSGVLGTAYDALANGECKVKVEVGVAPLPLPNGPGKGGTLIGGGANFIARPGDANSPKVAAAFKFAQYLASGDVQADFASATGYIPISKAAAETAGMQKVWAEKPGYKVAYDQLANGVQNVATQGPLIGPYNDVRTAMRQALSELFINNKSVDAVIGDAIKQANAAITRDNESQED